MSHTRWIRALGAAAVLLLLGGRSALLPAQAITTGSITGQVTDPGGQPLDQVQVVIVN